MRRKSIANTPREAVTTVRGVGHTFGCGLGLVTLVERHRGADDAKHHALDHAVAYIAPNIDAGLLNGPEIASVDPDQLHRHHISTQDTNCREHRSQQRHAQNAGKKARRQNTSPRVDRHELHRRDLLTGLHETNLGGERCAGTASKQQSGDHRPQLAHQRQVDDQAQRFGRTVCGQRVIHLQRQHKTHRQTRSQDDHQRAVANGMNLGDHQTKATQRGGHRSQQRQEKNRAVAPTGQQVQRDAAQALQRVHAERSKPKSSAIGGAG